MLPFLHQVLYHLIYRLQPFLVPFCSIMAWLLVVLVVWSLVSALRQVVDNAKQMHAVPCASCQFFTNTHFLKCPVHPSTALSLDAINCPDYCPGGSGYRSALEE
jgi:hypothetical protein